VRASGAAIQFESHRLVAGGSRNRFLQGLRLFVAAGRVGINCEAQRRSEVRSLSIGPLGARCQMHWAIFRVLRLWLAPGETYLEKLTRDPPSHLARGFFIDGIGQADRAALLSDCPGPWSSGARSTIGGVGWKFVSSRLDRTLFDGTLPNRALRIAFPARSIHQIVDPVFLISSGTCWTYTDLQVGGHSIPGGGRSRAPLRNLIGSWRRS